MSEYDSTWYENGTLKFGVQQMEALLATEVEAGLPADRAIAARKGIDQAIIARPPPVARPSFLHRHGAVIVAIVAGLLPLAFVFGGQWQAPDLAVASADVFGFIGLGLLGASAILGARSMPLIRLWGQRQLFVTHQDLAIWTLVLLTSHPLLLFVRAWRNYPDELSLLNPISGPWRLRFGFIAAALLLALLVLTVRRISRRFSTKRWRRIHRLVFLAVMAAALTHIILVGHYVESWQGVVIVGIVITTILLGLRAIRTRFSKALE